MFLKLNRHVKIQLESLNLDVFLLCDWLFNFSTKSECLCYFDSALNVNKNKESDLKIKNPLKNNHFISDSKETY